MTYSSQRKVKEPESGSSSLELPLERRPVVAPGTPLGQTRHFSLRGQFATGEVEILPQTPPYATAPADWSPTDNSWSRKGREVWSQQLMQLMPSPSTKKDA